MIILVEFRYKFTQTNTEDGLCWVIFILQRPIKRQFLTVAYYSSAHPV